jgi:hypothetical protein
MADLSDDLHSPGGLMRVTAKNGDDDYWRHYFERAPTVYLDGVRQLDVIEADDIRGYIVRTVIDRDGKPVIDGDHFVTEKVHGVVEIFGTKWGDDG